MQQRFSYLLFRELFIFDTQLLTHGIAEYIKKISGNTQCRSAAFTTRDFMPEDTKAGMIQAYLDKYTGNTVCSKQLYKEALNHAFDEPKQWEIREINEIMNQCIDRWRYFPNPRMFADYGRQKGWERENPATDTCPENLWMVSWKSQSRWRLFSRSFEARCRTSLPTLKSGYFRLWR